MVTLDPCERLKIIQTQLVPAILTSATYDVDTLDINQPLKKTCPNWKYTAMSLLIGAERNGRIARKKSSFVIMRR